MARRALALQFARFAAVGIANALTTFLALWLLHQGAGVPLGPAGSIAYVIGAVQGFLLSRYWTFTHAGAGAMAPQALGFAIVNLLCAALFGRATALFATMVPASLAAIGAALVTLPVSFGLYRWLVFRRRHPQ